MEVIFDGEVEVLQDGEQGIAGRAGSGKRKSPSRDQELFQAERCLGRDLEGMWVSLSLKVRSGPVAEVTWGRSGQQFNSLCSPHLGDIFLPVR